jgi:hypothetical protein
MSQRALTPNKSPGAADAWAERVASLTLPAAGPSSLIRRGSIAPHRMIKLPLVVSITLLSLADHAGEFFDRVEVPHRLGPLEQM